MARAPKLAWGIALGAWLTLTGGAFAALAHYGSTPGAPAEVMTQWPSDSALVRATDRPTLIMLAHPKCPCTHASLSELERLMARTGNRARAYVLFVRPSDDASFEKSAIIERARGIVGVEVVMDVNKEAERFGVTTSGHVVLFDQHGVQRFSGGITASRGHEGDNAGSDALRALIMGVGDQRQGTQTFGCELFGRGR